MVARNERPDMGCGVLRITNDHLGGARQKLFQEGGLDGTVDEDTGSVGADLARRIEVGHQGARHGIVEVGIGEHNQGGLSAQLHGHGLQGLGRVAHHLLTRLDRTGQGDFLDLRMTRQQPSGLDAALNHIKHPIRQARLGEDFGQAQGG